MRTIRASATTATRTRMTRPGERPRRLAGGAIFGSVVAVPHLKQISALSAIWVPQFLQFMPAFSLTSP